VDTGLLERAFHLALEAHAGRDRKGSGVPYLAHLLGVASIVLEYGGDDLQVGAALLHDAVEDAGGRSMLVRIGNEVDERVADLVDALSDSFADTTAGEQKAPWLERKARYLRRLAAAPLEALCVAAADKLYNARSLVRDYRRQGERLWAAFNEPDPAGQLWYYRSAAALLRERLRGDPRLEELTEELLDPEFDYIALGHYHQAAHPRRNAWYAGSTERIGWGDERVEPGYWLVELAGPGAEPLMTRVPIETRPMRTLPAVNGEGVTARELADRVLEALARLGQPEAMTRVELRNTPRPVRREAEALLRREAHQYVWWLQIYSPADILAPFARRDDVVTADVCTLFDRFVTEREKDYDPAFAEAFRQRGRRALEEALRDADLTIALEDAVA